jgi:hypothetical protein
MILMLLHNQKFKHILSDRQKILKTLIQKLLNIIYRHNLYNRNRVRGHNHPNHNPIRIHNQRLEQL